MANCLLYPLKTQRPQREKLWVAAEFSPATKIKTLRRTASYLAGVGVGLGVGVGVGVAAEDILACGFTGGLRGDKEPSRGQEATSQSDRRGGRPGSPCLKRLCLQMETSVGV